MSKKFIFSSDEDDILIEIIQQNRVIFDSSDPKHKDIIYRESIWKDIAEQLNRNSKYKIYCTKYFSIFNIYVSIPMSYSQ